MKPLLNTIPKCSLALIISVALSSCGRMEAIDPDNTTIKIFDRGPKEKRGAGTLLKSIYGTYITLEHNHRPVDTIGSRRDAPLECDVRTQIGYSKLTRVSKKGSSEVTRQLGTEFFDPASKQKIPADALWISPGVMQIPSGKEVCADFWIPAFADRGQWSETSTTLTYRFKGPVLVPNSFGQFESIQLTIDLAIDRLPNFDLGINAQVAGPLGEFSHQFVLRKN